MLHTFTTACAEHGFLPYDEYNALLEEATPGSTTRVDGGSSYYYEPDEYGEMMLCSQNKRHLNYSHFGEDYFKRLFADFYRRKKSLCLKGHKICFKTDLGKFYHIKKIEKYITRFGFEKDEIVELAGTLQNQFNAYLNKKRAAVGNGEDPLGTAIPSASASNPALTPPGFVRTEHLVSAQKSIAHLSEASLITAETARNATEASRISAEASRTSAEASRISAEASRISAEANLVSNKNTESAISATHDSNKNTEFAISAVHKMVDKLPQAPQAPSEPNSPQKKRSSKTDSEELADLVGRIARFWHLERIQPVTLVARVLLVIARVLLLITRALLVLARVLLVVARANPLPMFERMALLL